MSRTSIMVNFFTLCPKVLITSNNFSHHTCLTLMKGKLEPRTVSTKPLHNFRTYAEGPGSSKDPGKEEQIEKIKMPGFVHPNAQNEEGYFTQKAHQQLEELKKRLEKPTVDNTEKKE